MARSHQSLSRRERERAKKQKADDKRQRRLAKPDAEPGDPSEAGELDESVEPVEPVDEGDILRKLAELNAAFDAGDVPFDDFDEQRTALLSALTIE
jgi:hypothetical protein